MKYFYLLYFVLIISIYSCSTKHHNHIIIKPTNINPKEGKWLIDEPLLDKVDLLFESTTTEYYKELLSNKFSYLKSISDLNKMSTLKKAVDKDLKALEFYKQQTDFDYLISTKLEMTLCNKPLKKMLSIKILVYNLNTKSLILENEYHSWKKCRGSAEIKKFVDSSLKIAITDFAKKNSWKAIKSN